MLYGNIVVFVQMPFSNDAVSGTLDIAYVLPLTRAPDRPSTL